MQATLLIRCETLLGCFLNDFVKNQIKPHAQFNKTLKIHTKLVGKDKATPQSTTLDAPLLSLSQLPTHQQINASAIRLSSLMLIANVNKNSIRN